MFGNLPESRAHRQFRWGGSLASMTAHAALIGGAVVLTANAAPVASGVTTERIHALVEPPTPVPPVEVMRAPQQSAAANAAQGTPSIVMPAVTPIDLPSIDLRSVAPLDDEVIATTRRGQPGGLREVGGAGPIVGLSANHSFTADQVDKPVVLRPGTPSPDYPDALRQAGISGIVTVRFVVDSTGRVIESSIQVTQSDHERFAGSVRATLPRMRFLPAEYQGRKVSQLVQLPFRFDITP